MVGRLGAIGLTERSLGCILGGAIGDALGYPVEFTELNEIKRKYGPSGITEPVEVGGFYRFSDDTQMTVLTVCGLLFAESRFYSYGLMSHPMDYTWPIYRKWVRTQGTRIRGLDDYIPWVLNRRSMTDSRAPGSTCINSIASSDRRGEKEKPTNQSKGCGGLMRSAPAPIWCWKNRQEPADSMELAADVAASTHGHPLGWLTAGFLGSMIHHILDRQTLEDSVLLATSDCRKGFKDVRYLDDMLSLVDKAVSLAYSDLSDEECMASLGEGWIAEETLAMAIFACLRHQDDFASAVRTAVNVTGDSDSIGSVAGNIMGAYLGLDAVSQAFDVRKLEDFDMLEEVARDLATVCPLEPYGVLAVRWSSKYTYANYPEERARKDVDADERMLKAAIDEATKGVCSGHGEPFGCVIVYEGNIVGQDHDRVLVKNDPTAHGPINAIRSACRSLDTTSLYNCTLYASAEPCPMCKAAIHQAGVGRVVYSASRRDLWNVFGNKDLNELDSMIREVDLVPTEQMHVKSELEPFEKYKEMRYRARYRLDSSDPERFSPKVRYLRTRPCRTKAVRVSRRTVRLSSRRGHRSSLLSRRRRRRSIRGRGPPGL